MDETTRTILDSMSDDQLSVIMAAIMDKETLREVVVYIEDRKG